MISRVALTALLSLLGALGTAQHLHAETFTIDPVHSHVIYRAGHMGVSHSWGRFSDISGTVALDESNPEKSAIDITVKATSIDSGAAARDEHLRGPDFLNVKQFPTITFKSTQIKTIDPKTLEVTGDLTIHGVSKPVTLKVERVGTGKSPMGGSAVGLETTFKINRSDFDMKNMLNAIPDEVMLIVSLEAGHK
jgi:polyisoprenoid-binding protein YceI